MDFWKVNPYAFQFSAIILLLTIIYFIYGIFDRWNLNSFPMKGKVVSKSIIPPGKTYTTIIVNKRSILQTHVNQERYLLTLEIEVNGKAVTKAGVVVTEDVYKHIEVGELVIGKASYSRFSRQIIIEGNSLKNNVNRRR